jgi:hypothetical protein
MAHASIFPFLQMENIRETFQEAHRHPGQCSPSRRMFAYSAMHFFFKEFFCYPVPDMDVEAYKTYAHQCKNHMEVAMSQLEIFTPPTYENIMALMLGAGCAVEMCKPSLAWVMISSAAGLCQNLGYHRYQTMLNDSKEERNEKVHMFWMIYMFDKTMSLRLGRASSIQDWDISLPFLMEKSDSQDGPDGMHMLAYWIKIARVQGQTYEKLFSPAAFLQSSEERTEVAIKLVNSMNQAWYERCLFPVEDSN